MGGAGTGNSRRPRLGPAPGPLPNLRAEHLIPVFTALGEQELRSPFPETREQPQKGSSDNSLKVTDPSVKPGLSLQNHTRLCAELQCQTAR